MPALAVGSELRKQAPGSRLIYIGNRDSLEERLAKTGDIEFFPVSIKPLRRGVFIPNLSVPLLAISSILEARNILKRNNVKLVFGSGGFSSWPACAAARFSGVPYFLTDGNAYPGLVTRLLGRKATRVFVTFEETKAYFKKRVDNFLTTGFPVSSTIGKMNKQEAKATFGFDPGRITILVTGGSGGARSINKTLSQVKNNLLDKGYNLIWQTGKHWETEQEIQDATSNRLVIERFLEPARMAVAISAADLAITRCGIMTLSELAVAGLPAIMIPFPYSAEGHQEANALVIQSGDGGVMICDNELTPESLLNTIDKMIEPSKLKSLQKGIQNFARPDATQRIVKNMLETINA